ncbi:MAG: phage portal protein [Pseudogulbenkiania sp.]|nr:phage portal protein [Pseudogulbenkiania sp.]
MMSGFPTLRGRGFLMPTRLKNSYEGAGQGRRAANWQPGGGGPASTSTSGLQTLRNRSRHAARNDPYAFKALDTQVSNHIGTGISPKPKHPDAEVRRQLQEIWDDWCEESDADNQLDFYGQQALAGRGMFESGECFVRLRPRRLSDGLAVPLQIQLLEPEFVPHDKNGTAPNGNRIRQGIEFNGIGQRVAYWMYKSHPGERAGEGDYNSLMRVPADQVIHVFEPTRPGQLRGVPVLSTVLLRLKTLDEFDDAVLFRQEVANLFAGFIRKPSADAMFPGQQGEQLDAGYAPLVGLEPGTMQELAPGEEVEFSDPPDAGNNYPDFMRQQLAAIASGVGLPYELLTGDLRNINDRVIRVILNEFRRRVEQRQFGIFVHQLCKPVWKAVLDAAVLSGVISLPGYAANPRPYQRARWVPQGWAYTHPVQDVQADRLAVRSGFTSRSEVALKRGNDAETIDQETAADNARADELQLSYDSDPRVRDDQGEIIEDKP